MAELHEVQKENERLRGELKRYKSLEEDLVTQRVVENAKKQMTQWLTFGGLFLSLASFVGIKEVVQYVKDQAAIKFDSIGKQTVEEYLRAEEQKQISDSVQKLQGPLMEYAKQQIQVAVSPIGFVSPGNTSMALNAAAPGGHLDYSIAMLPARNEGAVGATVGFATAYALEFQVKKILNRSVRISPRYLYYLARGGLKFKGENLPDTGASLQDAINILSDGGAIAEDVWPYDPNDAGGRPPDTSHAERFKIKTSRRLQSVDDVKNAMKTSGPVIAGLSVYHSMLSTEVAKTGVVPMPSKNDELAGGHAVCIVSYDDDRQMFKFENMWGAAWGDGGYGYMSYAYFIKYADEAWIISM